MTDLEFEVLSLLTEDTYELWEIATQVEAVPGALRPTLRDLLGRGLIAWYCRAGAGDAAVPLPTGTVPPELDDDATWRPPAGDAEPRFLLMTATDEGVRDYFARRPVEE